VSGAVIAKIAQAAVERACVREVDTGEAGVRSSDLLTAVDAEFQMAARTLTPINCRRYLEDLPQDLDVVRVDTPKRAMHRAIATCRWHDADPESSACVPRAQAVWRRCRARQLHPESRIARRQRLGSVPGFAARDRLRDVRGARVPSRRQRPEGRQRRSSRLGTDSPPGHGGCVYIDLDHLELCLPEVLSAYDHVACWHAMLRLGQQTVAAANARRPVERRITVLVNNSDGHGQSYGSHLNFLLTRRAWDELVHRKLHHQAYLAAFQVSSIVLTGQGKVGSENGTPGVDYQIAQRADFIETLTGIQTTYRRPLINTRDEALCGAAAWEPPDAAAKRATGWHGCT
jgi:hypothetical protein